MRADAVRAGLEEPEEFFDFEKVKEVLKAALPHKKSFHRE